MVILSKIQTPMHCWSIEGAFIARLPVKETLEILNEEAELETQILSPEISTLSTCKSSLLAASMSKAISCPKTLEIRTFAEV